MENIKSSNIAIRYIGSKIINFLCDFGKAMRVILRIFIKLVCVIAFFIFVYLAWYYKYDPNPVWHTIFVVLILLDVFLWIYPFLMIWKQSKNLSKYLIENRIEDPKDANSENFSAFLNIVKKNVMYKGMLWSIELPIEKKDEKMRQNICKYVEENYVPLFNFLSFINSKKVIEIIMDNADRKLFTDMMVKKPDNQEYFCFDNSFLEYVDAFSPALKKHHELYVLEKKIGENKNAKGSK